MIHCIGDSHACMFSGYGIQQTWPSISKNRIPYTKSYRIGPATASHIKNKFGLIDNILNSNADKHNDIVLFVFGEVDCRIFLQTKIDYYSSSHIMMNKSGEWISKDPLTPEQIINSLVEKYFKKIITHYHDYNIAFFGPIASFPESEITYSGPWNGSNQQRNYITKQFNSHLKLLCNNHNIPFISIFDQMINDDLTTMSDYIDGGIHLKSNYFTMLFKNAHLTGLLDRQYTYVSYDTLIQRINDIPEITICRGGSWKHQGLRFSHKYLPISINEQEFNFMKDIILKNNLKNGFELATGTGISTIALGIAFNVTMGHLVSFDSYAEVTTQTQFHNTQNNRIYNTREYELITKMIRDFGIEDTVDLQIGISPVDTYKYLAAKNDLLDFVFLDCPKNDDDFERDIKSIAEFINKERYVIFIHDTHVYTEKANQILFNIIGNTYKMKYSYYEGTKYEKHNHYGLGICSKNILL